MQARAQAGEKGVQRLKTLNKGMFAVLFPSVFVFYFFLRSGFPTRQLSPLRPDCHKKENGPEDGCFSSQSSTSRISLYINVLPKILLLLIIVQNDFSYWDYISHIRLVLNISGATPMWWHRGDKEAQPEESSGSVYTMFWLSVYMRMNSPVSI